MTEVDVALGVMGIMLASLLVSLPLAALVLWWLRRDAQKFWGFKTDKQTKRGGM